MCGDPISCLCRGLAKYLQRFFQTEEGPIRAFPVIVQLQTSRRFVSSSSLHAGPHQPEAGVRDLQQRERLPDLQLRGGGGVEAGEAAPGRQVRRGQPAQVGPAQQLHQVVGEQVGGGQHGVTHDI